jgi:hypothetical protein
MPNLSDEEIDLLKAALCFVHLNRGLFSDYVEKQGHLHTMEYLESIDINTIRQKLDCIDTRL